MSSSSDLTIQALPSATDFQLCRFELNRPLLPGRSILCSDLESAQGSPLLLALMNTAGVRQVWVTDNRVSVEKKSDQAWTTLAPVIGRVIRQTLQSDAPPLAEELGKPKTRGALVDRIKQVLEERVNPSLASHGGRADLVAVEGGVVKLALSGGCQGCGAAQMTLKFGIERTLKDAIPEVVGVVDVTEHSQGDHPYFSSEETTPFDPRR